MKYSKIALATSMALAAFSAQAIDTGIPNPPDHVIFISGASGVDGYMGAAASSFLDATDPTYRYVHTGLTTDDKAWYGKTLTTLSWAAAGTNSAGSLPAGSNLLIIKRSTGGSAMGVIPLGRSTTIEVPDWSNGTSSVSASEYIVPLTTASAGLIPDIGVSDVEPAMFTGINTENGYTALTSIEKGTLTSASWSQLAEGIAVTRAVAENTVLSDNFIRGALTKSTGYTSWKKADGTTDPVIVCRRIEGSGTQAAFNSYFTGFPNTSTYNGYAKVTPAKTTDSLGYDGSHAGTTADPMIVDPSAGYTVFEGDGSGEARKCLQAAQNKNDITLKGKNGLQYRLRFDLLTNPGKAIGVVSLDSYTSISTAAPHNTTVPDGKGYALSVSDTNGEWTFRNLHGAGVYDVKNQTPTCHTDSTSWSNAACSTDTGIAPSRANILNSSYDFIVEPAMQYRTANAGSLTSAFFTSLKTVLGNPADLMVGSTKNTAYYAYAALPGIGYTKSATAYTGSSVTALQLVADLTRQGNTTAPLHVYK